MSSPVDCTRYVSSGPDDFRAWELATARALGAIQVELLEPILAAFPEITPIELGGPPGKASKE